MIGIYNYTVVLTYVSLASSVFGMTQAITEDLRLPSYVWPYLVYVIC